MNKISNSYIETYTGRKFYVLDPNPDDISIIDIAHALSMMCRYNGHSKFFYSVSEHSVLVANNVPKEHMLWGLLHDASEAYLADIASPIKPHLSNYKELEKNVMKAVCQRFGLPEEMPDDVHEIDIEMLRRESYYLMKSRGDGWAVNKGRDIKTAGGWILQCYTPEQAKLAFLETFNLLTDGR